jgi:two-component system chemotaxis response regulator CheY
MGTLYPEKAIYPMAVNKAMSILVVDDYGTTRSIVRALLLQLGFKNVDEAIDGKDALKKLHEKSFSLIISDWNMDPMTGLQLLQMLRADAKLKNLPFIMVTAENKPENIIAAKQAGVSNYIAKPFAVDTLKAKIISIFGAF